MSRISEADPSFRGHIGVGRRDMTPEVGIYNHNWGSAKHDRAESIHKPLFASAIAFRSSPDARPLILATIDYCWFHYYRNFDKLRTPILNRLGLAPEQLLLVVTHSHSVPHIDPELEEKPGGDKIPAYRAKVSRALNEAIDAALASVQPAILTWGRGHSSLARKRDFLDPESGRILCGPNPDGVADGTLMVGRITAADSDDILATLVNYACHPVSLGGGNRSISPDYIGALRERVQSETGNAPCLFLHGPSGDQTPRDCYASDPAVADANGETLGLAALATLRAMLPPGQRVEFARLESSGAPLAIWERRPYTVDGSADAAVEYLQLPAKDWPSLENIDAQLRDEQDLAARTRLTRLREFMQNFHDGLGRGFPVWVMRLGQSFLVGTPAEPFTDLQIELRKRFPQLAIAVTNDTNGSFNYLPPKGYYGNGSYEQDCSDYGPGGLEMVIAAAGRMIEQMLRKAA